MTMSRAFVVPVVLYVALLMLLLAAQERYGWSNEAIGWPVLILIGATTLLRLWMKEREDAEKAETVERAAASADGAAGAAQLASTRKPSSST